MDGTARMRSGAGWHQSDTRRTDGVVHAVEYYDERSVSAAVLAAALSTAAAATAAFSAAALAAALFAAAAAVWSASAAASASVLPPALAAAATAARWFAGRNGRHDLRGRFAGWCSRMPSWLDGRPARLV